MFNDYFFLGGDVVSDDGLGSISIYGETFKDENLDTQHTMAGFVSMANKGENYCSNYKNR